MRSKVAVIVSLLFVLAIGGAALAVNTRILNTSPQPDIGRATEVLVPGGAQPAPAPAPPAALAFGLRRGDADRAATHRVTGRATTNTPQASARRRTGTSMNATTDSRSPRPSPARWSKLAASDAVGGSAAGHCHRADRGRTGAACHAEHRRRQWSCASRRRDQSAHRAGTCDRCARSGSRSGAGAERTDAPARCVESVGGGIA